MTIFQSSMTEDELQDSIVKSAELYGWRHYHTHDSRHSVAGFPDLVLVKPPLVMFLELKTETGEASDAQSAWLADLERCENVTSGLIRPSQLDALQRRLAQPITTQPTENP